MENTTAPGPSHANQPKLYGITRADLPAGLRAAQVGHALITWALRYGRPPENLVLLEVADEEALALQLKRCTGCGVVPFYEPDLDNALTAFAVGPDAARLLSSLPLLLRAA